MIFEIINPSDSYTMESDEWPVAVYAGLILGEGTYGLEGLDNDNNLPVFLFGGYNEWIKEEFGSDFKPWVQEMFDNKKIAIADCLDSVLIGSKSDRESYNKGLEFITEASAKKEWRDHWHDKRRSSLNNIGLRAWTLAERLRESDNQQSS